ncbi:MAG: tetratricopeptide repeat protein [Synergistaceae bacterium]|nr:tetratricopeptide repeat protein [Synergistaceae bacterium]
MRIKSLGIAMTFLLCAFPGLAEAIGWVSMGNVEVEGRVIAIAADFYVIDIGVALESAKGSNYLVYSEGGEVYNAEGALIGDYKIPKAVIRASAVSTTGSICKIVLPSKEWVIERGDGVIPISEASAHSMKFATYRTTPDPPEAPGYNGRWVRVSPITDPASAIVRYHVPWVNPVMPQGSPLAAPGYYYVEFPAAAPALILPGGAEIPRTEIPYASPPQAAAPPPAEPLQPPYWLEQPDNVLLPDFDVNQITDVRLIKTFPLTDVEMYALEIQHRSAYILFEQKRYREALYAFGTQSMEYIGNYLSPYWAGKSAQKLNEKELAIAWFSRALAINANYKPAADALKELDGSRGSGSKK